ncbi:hypothetical protein HDV01_001846 [Terramyces sp. JEL0728]|nr:hypothetical protein HDV01_001846 [Terramyces sp. JEL0728]
MTHANVEMDMFQHQYPTQDELTKYHSNEPYQGKLTINCKLLHTAEELNILNSPYGRKALLNKVSPDVAIHAVLHADLNLPYMDEFLHPSSRLSPDSDQRIITAQQQNSLQKNNLQPPMIQKEELGFTCPVCRVKLKLSRSMKSHLKSKHSIYSKIEGDNIKYNKL